MIQKIPYLIALLGMCGGVLIAIFFGINEDLFKDRIKAGLSHNAKIQQMTDETEKKDKIKHESEKNWRYYQRFHFHSTGIGAMSMASLLFLGFLAAPMKRKLFAAYCISIGGFLYPFVWLFAAIYGPEMGRGEAKEAFALFGYMGGVFLIGLIATMVMAVRYDMRILNEN